MFHLNPPEKTKLEMAMDEVLQQMEGESADTEDYAKMVDRLEQLHRMKTEEGRRRVSPDVRANIIANIVVTFLIIGHERAHIITTKAFSFIRRLG